jgi:hypothetical protein
MSVHQLAKLYLLLILGLPFSLPAQTYIIRGYDVQILDSGSKKASIKKVGLYFIRGQITDSVTGKPLPYTTVGLLKKESGLMVKGVTSDTAGKFVISYQESGSFVLVMQLLGYRPIKKEIILLQAHEINLGKIRMQASPVNLQEVVIKPLIEQTATEIIYNITSDPDRDKSSLQDILKKVPFIQMRPDGSFFVDSPDKKFEVVRNGRKDALFTDLYFALSKLPATGFTKIKILLEPPKRYGGADYVVNIVTDSTVKVVGAIGSVHDDYSYETNNFTFTPSTTFSSERVRGNVKFDYDYGKPPGSSKYTTQYTPLMNSTLNLEETLLALSKNYRTGGSFSYDLSRRQFVTLSINLSKSESSSTLQKSMENWLSETISKQYLKTGSNNADNSALTINLNYEFDFRKPNRILNIGYLLTGSVRRIDGNSFLDGILNTQNEYLKSDEEKRPFENKLQFHYSDPLNKKVTLESGLGLLHRKYYTENHQFQRNGLSQEWQQDTSLYRLMDKNYSVVDGYLSLTYTISKKISMSGTLKADYLFDGKGTLLKSGKSTRYISEAGFSFNPVLGINCLILNKRYTLRYSMNQYRPSLEYLDPYIDQPESEIIKVGNPELKPESRHSFSLGTNYGKKRPVSLTLSTAFSNNAISQYWYKNEKSQTVSTFENFGKYRSYNLSSMMSVFAMKKLNITAINGLAYSEATSSKNEKTKTVYLRLLGNATYIFKNGLQITLIPLYYKSWNKGLYYTQMNPFIIGININKSYLNQKFTFDFGISNLVRYSVRSTQYVNTVEFNTTIKSKMPQNYPLYLKIFYRFGKFKVKPLRNTRKSASINDLKQPE